MLSPRDMFSELPYCGNNSRDIGAREDGHIGAHILQVGEGCNFFVTKVLHLFAPRVCSMPGMCILKKLLPLQ